jgi:hypothetical protein
LNIFISYKSEDREAARALVTALRSDGLDVWWDQDIPPSAPWEASITHALANAGCVIVCWTKRSVDATSGAKVQVEAREALDNDMLVQVLLEPVQPPLFFRHYQAGDLSTWNGAKENPKFVALAKAARQVLNGARPELLTMSTAHGRKRRMKRLLVTYLGAGLLVMIVSGVILFRDRALETVCAVPGLNALCPTYDVAALAPELQELVTRVRGAVEAAELAGIRARGAETMGQAAAEAARTGQAEARSITQPGLQYAGGWANDKANGFGKISWGNGSASVGETYVGQFKDWAFVNGVFIYPPGVANTSNVRRYEGEWAPEPGQPLGNWNGHGVVRRIDNSVYKGEIRHGTFDGLGALTKADGTRIEGRWARDVLVEHESVTWGPQGRYIPPKK